jgi:predicted component of type VI protein secretion system
MKVTLVVASGAHQGKVIPITGSQFLIGRDPQCHLRPASQAISKRHCGILVRDGKVYVCDYGSTNGTTVNNELVKDAEVAVVDGASLKLGPLDFTIRVEVPVPNPDGTPLPANPETAAALAAVKAATGTTPKAPLRDATPNPAKAAKPGSKEAVPLKAPAKPAAPANATPAPTANTSGSLVEDDHDKIAAMLLGMEDDSPSVPDGSTVVEIPAVDAQGNPVPPAAAPKADEKGGKKPVQSREEMSTAANDILRKMMRRPK